ncbi:membrane-spanning 4-domains subfamily A member 4A-like isoform X2 [Osmerus eperlanus]|uniref:membrane-spanning 4-domains subfamily A member 4A-like isoform X2 n=1 Tax=Osmerus eperlanus TaxID=29151 RepID=UPI002E0E524B
MSSSVSTTTNGVVVITHVHPAGNGLGMGAPSPPTCMGRVGPVVSSVMERFREGHPKALGTVQIMVGAITFLFGIVMAVGELSLGVLSGIFVWGSIIYIIAGSLTIAAEKSLNKCLVKASLGMNVVATVTAGIGTVLYSVDAAGVFYYCYNYYEICYQYWAKHQGISGIMLLFSLLEMMVTISVSAFACKAVCHSPPEQMFIVGNHLPQGYSRLPCAFTDNIRIPPNSYETLRTPKGAEEGLPPYDNNRPPPSTVRLSFLETFNCGCLLGF